MKKYTLLLFLLIVSNFSFCQLSKRPEYSDVRSYNQGNLLNITIGMNRQQVIDAMGGIKQIQVFDRSRAAGNKKVAKINNPYSRDLKRDTSSNNIEILWYYTDKKSESNSINKSDLTPIVFENNLVVGLGWGFFEDYAKRKEIFINSVSN